MTKEYFIIDNFLSQKDFLNIKNTFFPQDLNNSDIFFQSWFGTKRIDILAKALDGNTVLAPSPLKLPIFFPIQGKFSTFNITYY